MEDTKEFPIDPIMNVNITQNIYKTNSLIRSRFIGRITQKKMMRGIWNHNEKYLSLFIDNDLDFRLYHF
jgi:hypothetical protein